MLRDTLADAVRRPFDWARHLGSGRPSLSPKNETMWALSDVSFEVQRGEVIGVIGHNGAGKSTLLKILSRITRPTLGRATLYGRLGSLLEVGTGFHSELTGRENIYLNGAVLGMRKKDIERRFDEIVEFAEVEKFLDTQVKFYSTGMYMRLAFAVAVHLEPEILIIDEVLAVGDAQFQRKCLQKMQEIGRGGRTILFVSHNMSAVRHICTKGLVLQRGEVVNQGPIDDVVDDYLLTLMMDAHNKTEAETESFVINDVSVASDTGEIIKTFDTVEVKVDITAKVDVQVPGLYIGILTMDGQRIAGLDYRDFGPIEALQVGQSVVLKLRIRSLPILPGEYQLELCVKDMNLGKYEFVARKFPLSIVETPIYGGRQLDKWFGVLGLRVESDLNEQHVAIEGAYDAGQ